MQFPLGWAGLTLRYESSTSAHLRVGAGLSGTIRFVIVLFLCFGGLRVLSCDCRVPL